MTIFGLHIELASTHKKRKYLIWDMGRYLRDTALIAPREDNKNSNIWNNTLDQIKGLTKTDNFKFFT